MYYKKESINKKVAHKFTVLVYVFVYLNSQPSQQERTTFKSEIDRLSPASIHGSSQLYHEQGYSQVLSFINFLSAPSPLLLNYYDAYKCIWKC